MTTEQLDAVIISPNRLAGINRRRNVDKLSESINGSYYFDRDGWVRYGEFWTTEQGQRLEMKGWRRIEGAPRPDVNREHDQKWDAFFRWKDGPAMIPAAQVVAHHWHKTAPVIQLCREPLDDYNHPEHTQACFGRVRFAQLEGVTIYEATCPMCKRYFATTSSQGEVEVMLKNHTEVNHKSHLVNTELTTGLRDALAPMMAGGGGNMTPDLIAQIAAAAAAAVMEKYATTQPPNIVPEGEDRDHDVPHQGAPETSGVSEVEDVPVEMPNQEPVGDEDEPKKPPRSK
jgi:hypothetical protein